MNEELEVLKLVSQRLDQGAIPHMITGSIAMNYYATPRLTRDLDIIIELEEENIAGFIRLFEKDFYVDDQMILEAVRCKNMFNIIHNQWVIKVDCIIRKSSTYRELEFGRRRKVDSGDFFFWIVSPEDLILSKLDWAKESMSDFQLRDVRNLLENVEELNIPYLEKWVKKLSLERPYAKVKT